MKISLVVWFITSNYCFCLSPHLLAAALFRLPDSYSSHLFFIFNNYTIYIYINICADALLFFYEHIFQNKQTYCRYKATCAVYHIHTYNNTVIVVLIHSLYLNHFFLIKYTNWKIDFFNNYVHMNLCIFEPLHWRNINVLSYKARS